MKIIKSLIVALLLLSSACNEIFGTNLDEKDTQYNEIINKMKKNASEKFSYKIAADIAATVAIYRLLPISVTKWSYHFLFMDFYAGYTMLGWAFLSPKFLTFCKEKLRIGFIDISLDFWRLIPLAMTHRFCRKKCYDENKWLLAGLVFCGVNSIDGYLMYVQWKYIKIGIFDVVSFIKASAANKAKDEGRNSPTWLYFPFFLDNETKDTYYDGHPSSFYWLIYFPKISLDLFELFNNHDNEQTENDIE